MGSLGLVSVGLPKWSINVAVLQETAGYCVALWDTELGFNCEQTSEGSSIVGTDILPGSVVRVQSECWGIGVFMPLGQGDLYRSVVTARKISSSDIGTWIAEVSSTYGSYRCHKCRKHWTGWRLSQRYQCSMCYPHGPCGFRDTIWLNGDYNTA